MLTNAIPRSIISSSIPISPTSSRMRRITGLLRQLSLGPFAIEFVASATRFLRRAHLRARRQTGRLSHRMDGVRSKTGAKKSRTEGISAASHRRIGRSFVEATNRHSGSESAAVWIVRREASPKVVRLAPDQLVVGERSDFARFD